MDKAKLIVKYLISLITQPEQTWIYLANQDVDEAKPQYMQTNYYLPLLGFMSLFIFVVTGMDGVGSFSLQKGMTSMVPATVAYFVAPYLAMFIIRELLTSCIFKMSNPDHDRLQLYVFYSTSYLMLVEMAAAMMPSFAFIRLAAYYLIYITWTGSHTMIRVEEHRRWMFGFVAFMVINFSPSIIIGVLKFMQH